MLEAAGEVGFRYLPAGLKERVAEQQFGRWPLFCALHFSPGSAAHWILWDLLSLHKPHLLTFSLSSPLFLIYVYGPSARRRASGGVRECTQRDDSLQPRWLPLSARGLSSLVPPRTAIPGACQTEQKETAVAVPMNA